jgi:hypothetical protein
VTPTLSVDAVHDRFICPEPAAVAVNALGAVGGTSSGATETSTLALAFNPLLSVAVRMIS